MKKLAILCFIVILFTLYGCGNKKLNTLEKKVREFDYCTEIFEFQSSGSPQIKLLVAYSDNSEEITYIYYANEILQGHDREILFFVGEELIHEDFIVPAYTLNNEFLGQFNASELSLLDVSLADCRFVFPGGYLVESSIFVQEFNLVTNKTFLDTLGRTFVESNDYYDLNLNFSGINRNQKNSISIFTSLFVGIILFFTSIIIYQKIYQKNIDNIMKNPDKPHKKIPDVIAFKIASMIVCFIIVIILLAFSASIINNNYDNYGLYDKDSVNYEQIVSDDIALNIGNIKDDNLLIFIDKMRSRKIINSLEITINADTTCKAYANGGGSGGYKFSILYRFLEAKSISLASYELLYDDDETEERLIYYRLINIQEE